MFRFPWLAVVILLVVFTLILYSQSTRTFLYELLIPGNAKVTVEAIDDFSENIKNGMEMQQAVTAFCHEILSYEDTSARN